MEQSIHAPSKDPAQQQQSTAQKRAARPRFGRSQSATADLSPPRPSADRSSTNPSAQPFSKKLPFPIQSGVDRAKQRGERIAHAFVDRTPVSAVADRVRGHERHESFKRSAAAPTDSEPSLDGPAEAEATPVKTPRRAVTDADVEKEKLRRFKRNEELQTTAERLTGLARDSTRRVDTIYYSMLEKASSLRSSISGLNELSQNSRRLLDEFEANAGNVDRDLSEQVKAFDGFKRQRDRVTGLEDRIHKSMKKTETLSDRLEVARKRTDLWEKRENEWQARTSMRVRVGWSVFGVLTFVVMMVIAIRQICTAGHQLQPRFSGPHGQINETFMEQLRAEFKADVEKTRPLKPLRMKHVKDELPKRRLRKLDEL